MTVLGVFFTRGVSLKRWVASGLFSREVLIYRYHLDSGQFSEVVWFTYGTDDATVADDLHAQGCLPPQIQVVPMPGWLSMFGRGASLIYAFLMPFLVQRHLGRCAVFKTNQMDGALAAVVASKLFKRPLYVRTGYTLSLFVDRIHACNPLRRGFAWLTEIIAFRYCAASSVSSRYDRDYIVRRYGLSEAPPAVIGNYIDIKRFSPREGSIVRERMVFVGRLSPQKNLDSAIAACVSAGVGLDIIGDGPDRSKLQALARDLGADIGWFGVLPNDRLPEVLAAYRYFFLPSLWEGMPKALLEAMAAGMVCVGNDAIGINEVIRDGVTGYLSSGADVHHLAQAVRRALVGDHVSVSAAGRAFVCENYSLDTVAGRELAILANLRVAHAYRGRTW